MRAKQALHLQGIILYAYFADSSLWLSAIEIASLVAANVNSPKGDLHRPLQIRKEPHGNAAAMWKRGKASFAPPKDWQL
jgi:hypothetical protein